MSTSPLAALFWREIRVARRIGVSTDSSHRFARDVDPAGVELASRLATDLLVELAGAQVVGPAVAVGHAPAGGAARSGGARSRVAARLARKPASAAGAGANRGAGGRLWPAGPRFV